MQKDRPIICIATPSVYFFVISLTPQNTAINPLKTVAVGVDIARKKPAINNNIQKSLSQKVGVTLYIQGILRFSTAKLFKK